jgi:hypothetical protein
MRKLPITDKVGIHVTMQVLGQGVLAYLFWLGGYNWNVVPREGLVVSSTLLIAFMVFISIALCQD